MAAKLPRQLNRSNRRIHGGVNPVTTSLITVGTLHGSLNGLRHTVWPFFGADNDIDDADVWTSGIQGIVALAWQANQANTDLVTATLTTAATGAITFKATNAGSVGWLHVWSHG